MYTVEYHLYQNEKETHEISLCAKNKMDAHMKAVYDLIPKKEGQPPYSAWVYSKTYQNGNYKLFNTFEGKPF